MIATLFWIWFASVCGCAYVYTVVTIEEGFNRDDLFYSILTSVLPIVNTAVIVMIVYEYFKNERK